MFKIGMALLFAVISALAIALAGLASEARISTILLRGLAGFLVAGVFSYMTAVILEAKGWADFDADTALSQDGETDSEDYEGQDDESESSEEDAADLPDVEAAEEFAPFSADNFEHIEQPPGP